ncbi:thioesterase [candidate division KSB1 bacterium]|nr:thioesterase [candidate division KSB1 bacterium]
MQRTSAAGAWLVIPKPNTQARVRLFCFPHAGGGAFEYRAWSPLMPHDVELCAVQLPGRETRLQEPPFTRLLDLTKTLAEVLAPRLDKPFAFFGHSLGALVGFELARELRRKDYPAPIHFFASGARAPQLPDPDPPVHHLRDREMMDEINRRYRAIPREILESAEMLELLLPALRADFTINDTYAYTHEPPFDFPITCCGGIADDNTSLEHLQAWRLHTRNAFALKMFSGGHFFIRTARAPLLQTLAEQLNGKPRFAHA